jgi:7-carboxy-7-deazaguanine synthase
VLTVNVTETFLSVQGESSHVGRPCFFIRLSGCNLRCSYCDTTYAYEDGNEISVEDLVSRANDSGCTLIEVTGGEPLMQDGFIELASGLLALEGREVLVETNGSRDISIIPDGVVAIIDVKCPGSGESESFDMENLQRIRCCDEMKFVLSDRADYDWSKEFILENRLNERCKCIHMGVAHGAVELVELAKWVVGDKLDVRVQVQLHKMLGLK